MYYFFVISTITVLFVNVYHCDAHVLTKRVVGGEPISISKAPWMAIIAKKNGNYYCGGTIISDRAILTAAHCVFGRTVSDVSVVIGVSEKDEIKAENRFSVKRFIPHSQYNGRNFQNDIAILILEHSVDETKYPPIKLPAAEKQNYKNACIAGWGYTSTAGPASNELREVCFTSNDFKDCSVNWANVTDLKTHICVGAKGKDSCYGDGGGPLYTEDGGKATEIGIVSIGNRCGEIDSVYTRVSEHVQWIHDTMKIS